MSSELPPQIQNQLAQLQQIQQQAQALAAQKNQVEINLKETELALAEIEKLDLKSMDIVEEKREQLKSLFPEAFTEGQKIDFERLKLTLGDMVDPGKERYGMNWPGKADCFKIIQQPSIAALTPARDESVDFDTTENLFIEGDNLEVLKLLQKSYFGKCQDDLYRSPVQHRKRFHLSRRLQRKSRHLPPLHGTDRQRRPEILHEHGNGRTVSFEMAEHDVSAVVSGKKSVAGRRCYFYKY